jgi:AcrR family transcriptional regulator
MAAKELFSSRGYAETSLADVARRAGTGISSVYHHFPDKRAMLLEIIDDWGDHLPVQRRAELDIERVVRGEGREAVRQFLRRIYEQMKRGPSFHMVVLSLAERDPEVRRRYQRNQQILIEWMREMIERGQRIGLIREGPDPRSVAFILHYMIEMVATQLVAREGGDLDAYRVLEELTEMIVRFLAIAEPST